MTTLTAAALDGAIYQTTRAALAYNKALHAAKDVAWFSSDDHKALNQARSVTIGRATITAGVGGNTRATHVRHTFKIDGKRACRAEVYALVHTA